MAKLPKTLFIKEEKDNDITYFVADKDLLDIGELNEKIRVGVYELKRVLEIEGVVSQKEIPNK